MFYLFASLYLPVGCCTRDSITSWRTCWSWWACPVLRKTTPPLMLTIASKSAAVWPAATGKMIQPYSYILFIYLSANIFRNQDTVCTLNSYSRGYKNRASVKKMFEISPIFYECIECQLFMLMKFFDSRKDLTCMLGPFVSQSVHVGRHRRPWLQPFFFLLEFFTRCLVKMLLDVLKKFQYLKKWGLWPNKGKEYQR